MASTRCAPRPAIREIRASIARGDRSACTGCRGFPDAVMAPALQSRAAMRSNLTLIVLSVALAAGCGNKPSEAPIADRATTENAMAAASDEAKTTFKTICATCHGESGLGNGPASAALTPKPRNYTDKTWQASVTDEQIKQTILMGGAAIGKSPAMPAQPQLKEKPEVVAAMVQIIRGFGK